MTFIGGSVVATLVLCSVTPHGILTIEIAPPTNNVHRLFTTLPDKVFVVTQAFVALLVTGGFVTSRSLMAKVAPRAMLNEFFGLYAVSGTASSFIGPLAIVVLTSAFNSQRAGVAVGIVFLLVGGFVLTKVHESLNAT